MSLYEIAEDAYFVRSGGVSTLGIAAAVDAVEPLIRADALTHAEAVAARLVEVVCEMQAEAEQADRDFITGDAARVDRLREAMRERDAARAEVEQLARWKAEVTAVIEAWEQVHRLLGSPGRIGESKAAATYETVAALEPGRVAHEARVAERERIARAIEMNCNHGAARWIRGKVVRVGEPCYRCVGNAAIARAGGAS